MKKNTLLLCFLLCLPQIASADILKLKSGKTWEGKITEQTDTFIKIDIGVRVPVTFWRDEIDSITEKPFDFKKFETPPKRQEPLIVIHRNEVEDFVAKLEATFQNKDDNGLRHLISDHATFAVFKNGEKNEMSRDDYLQMLQRAGMDMTEHTYDFMIDDMKLDGPRAMTIETLKENMTTSTGQKLEITTKQKSLYRKNKNGTVQLIYSDVNTQ